MGLRFRQQRAFSPPEPIIRSCQFFVKRPSLTRKRAGKLSADYPVGRICRSAAGSFVRPFAYEGCPCIRRRCSVYDVRAALPCNDNSISKLRRDIRSTWESGTQTCNTWPLLGNTRSIRVPSCNVITSLSGGYRFCSAAPPGLWISLSSV